ncbi:hypothetical protein N9R29_01390 [Gammaproteobacteria bacterium]|nr:hypothetical protein [Gammaproteobacteria bacterium]
MEALVNLLAQYFGIDPAVIFAAINAQQASEDNRVVNDNVALDSSDAADVSHLLLNFHKVIID